MSEPSIITLVPVTSQTRTEAATALRLHRDLGLASRTAVLRSLGAPIIGDVDMVLSVEDLCEPYEPRALVPEDQIALAQPKAIARLLETHDAVIWLGSGLLPTGVPLERSGDAVQVAARGAVRSLNSGTPLLSALISNQANRIEPRLMVVSQGATAFLADWLDVCREAVVDIYRGSVLEYSNQFVIQATSTGQAQAQGEGMLLLWSEFARLGSATAVGRLSAYVLADELFLMERQQVLDGSPSEYEWRMVHGLVHDVRPIEFLANAITASAFFRPDPGDRLTRFIADVRRAVDPMGKRWSGAGSEEEFRGWLSETNQFGISRASEMLIRQHELWWKFPGARRDPKAFHAWLEDEGVESFGFDPRTLIPAEEPRTVVDSPSDKLSDRFAWRWNVLKSLIPGAKRRLETKQMEHVIGPDPKKRHDITPPKRIDVVQTPSLWGVAPRPLTLVGPLRSESGLGQAARMSLRALQLLGRDFTHVDASDAYPSRNLALTGLDWTTHGSRGDVNLVHANAFELVALAQRELRHHIAGRFNAAVWFWEPGNLPELGRFAFDGIDELWVASEYLVDVFGQYGKVPVHNIGLAAELPEQRHVDRSALGLSDDEFVFLFVYDAYSSYGRKNPMKALEAFVNAFAPRFEGVRFVLKVSNLNKFPAAEAEILGLTHKYPAITVIPQYLTREEVLDLMAAADIYVSLHAAEGFGLTLLEAMALGTPTICTGYSGNMDFTTPENSWLVEYDLIATDEVYGPYPAGSIWASPNLDSATELLRHVEANRHEVARKAEVARTDALAVASLDAYARRLDTQLRRVGA